MKKIDNASNTNFKLKNEGKNLISSNQIENIDSSNNYERNFQGNFLDKNNKKELPQKKIIKKFSGITSSERNPALVKIKDKNIISSKELKSEININNFNNVKPDINRKDSILSSSLIFTENKFISKFKKIYSSKQKYISIILLIYSIFLFAISIFDLFQKIQDKNNNYLLINLIIFILEMVCSGLIFLFHIIYYFLNIGNKTNKTIFLIMSIIILVFSLLYIRTYVIKNVRFFEIIINVVNNLLLVIINIIYLFMIYYIDKKNNKFQRNIDDIINISLRNEKMPNYKEKNVEKDKKENKIKAVALVEEEK